MKLVGFHCHIGSQIFALHSFREAAQVMIEFIARVQKEYGIEIPELDLGGGLGVAYLATDKPSSIDDFAECTTRAVKDFCAEYGVAEPRILVEPGRSLVANAGVNDVEAKTSEAVTLCGKHCESGDAVVIDMPIQHPEIGDIACVFTTGAYCSTMSSNYNGQPKPAVVFVKDGVARVVTRRETYADLYARDI